jgi:hypothetical protein
MRDTGDAQRRLHLVRETRRNAGDGETYVVVLITQRRGTIAREISEPCSVNQIGWHVRTA